MAEKSSDWSLRGPVSTDLDACVVLWDCIDLTARTKVRGSKTFTYCGTGRNSRLLAVTDPQRQPGTATLRGAEEEIIEILEEFDVSDCPLYFQRVSCDGVVEHYSGVYLGDQSAVNALTANGPGAVDNPLLEDVTLTFDRITRLRRANNVPINQYVSNTGYHSGEALFGTVNGTNTAFTLTDTPISGYPITVYIDGVATTAYTISGINIVFDTAPACGEVLTADYYDEAYYLWGLCPVSVIFCEDSCSDDCKTCGDVYGIYESTIEADPDVCGLTDGFQTIVARWDFTAGTADPANVELLENVIGAQDAICTNDGQIIIAADNGLFEGCSSGFTAINPASLPAGVSIRKLAYDSDNDLTYALYGNNGVLKRSRTGNWNITLTDGSLTTEFMNDIASESGAVIAGGVNNATVVSSNSGLTWTARQGPGTTGNNILALAVGPTNDPGDDRVLISTLIEDGTDTNFHVSDDYSVTWSDSRKVWNFVPTVTNPQICMFEDWLVYVQIGDETWRNSSRGCSQCNAWEQLLDTGYVCTVKAVCEDDPNKISTISRPLEAALPDSGTMSGTVAQVGTFDVVANDYTDVTDCTIDSSTLAILSVSDSISADVTTAVTVGFEIEVTVVNGVASGTVGYIEYTVDTTCTNGDTTTLQGLLAVDFLA